MDQLENVILVNDQDEAIGTMEKMEAHQKGVLHRAFSIFIINDKKEILLQQRASSKYHSPNLWTNACCSHQRVGENNIDAGKRRLMEEMGFTTELQDVFSFIYLAPFENGLTEHEFDHVLVGFYNENPQINPNEVKDFKWVSYDFLKKDLIENEQDYTIWFKIIFQKFEAKLLKYV